MPSVFCHRPVKEGVLQEKVQRHKRLVERKENIARSESAQALLTLSMDKPEKCAGTATQTPVVHHCDSEVQSDITLPVMISLIVTNQFLKNICDSNAVTIKNSSLINKEPMKFVASKKMSSNHWNPDFKRRRKKNTQLLEELKKKTLSFKTIEGMIRKLNSTQDFQISKLSMQCS